MASELLTHLVIFVLGLFGMAVKYFEQWQDSEDLLVFLVYLIYSTHYLLIFIFNCHDSIPRDCFLLVLFDLLVNEISYGLLSFFLIKLTVIHFGFKFLFEDNVKLSVEAHLRR